MPTKNNSDKRKNLVLEQMAKIRRLLHTSRGKDILLFLFFLCVSYVFWLIMRLNDETQRDFSIQLQIVDVPADVKFLSDIPQTVSVTVKDKGISLTRATYGGMPKMTVRYTDLVHDEGSDRLILTQQMINSQLRNIFSNSAQIMSVTPDSMSVAYTDRKPVRVAVRADIDVSTDRRSEISGPISIFPDSVDVYLASSRSRAPKEIVTEKYSAEHLGDTARVELRLLPGDALLVDPRTVTATIPVETLINTTSTVPVYLINADKFNVVMMPNLAEVKYLLPMSFYGAESESIVVRADFSKRSDTMIPLEISSIPDYVHNAQLITDSIGYYIERPPEHVDQ